MVYFFYYTRNIAGLILVISPLVGFLFIDNVSVFSTLFLLPFAAGCLSGSWLSRACCRMTAGAFAAGSLAGAFLCLLGRQGAVLTAGTVLLAFCLGALLAGLPPLMAVGWFRNSKIAVLTLTWTVSLPAGCALAFFVEKNTYAGMSAAALLLASGLLFFMQTPPFLRLGQHKEVLYGGDRRSTRIKVFLFLLAVSFSLGFALIFSGFAAGVSNGLLLFMAGIVTGPVLSGLLTEKKGICSGAVLLIFLAETAVSCCTLSDFDEKLFGALGILCLGMCLSSVCVVIPVLLFYLHGPAGCCRFAGSTFCALPAGLMMASLFSKAAANLPYETNLVMIPVLILLIFAFLTMFSAWKHRLFLLK